MKKKNTDFAPAERTPARDIASQREMLANYYGPLSELFNAVSEIILIVNEQRQIVFFNSHVPETLGVNNPESLYGLRPGEAIRCAYACTNDGGCGTSKFCKQCGAVHAILAALSNKTAIKECRVLHGETNEAFDFLIRTTPLQIQDHKFSIVAITDISHEKRRRALERVFFHDIMNTAISFNIVINMLNEDPHGGDAEQFRTNLLLSSRQLIDELKSHKDLLAAENNELSLHMRPVDAAQLVKDVVEVLARRFGDHRINIESSQGIITFTTDYGLVSRVIANMITNAVEASSPEEPVRVECCTNNDWLEFKVHNKAAIPADVQLQIFQRSFSTKGPGRGLGTYSIKLLSERYLKGRVSFESSPQKGTTFTARFPLT